MKRKLFEECGTILISALLLLCSIKGTSQAQANIPLDSRIYHDLEWLAALGYLPTYSAAIKPLSRLETAALILEGERQFYRRGEGSHPTVSSTLHRLKRDFRQEIAILEEFAPEQKFIKPIEKLRIAYIHQKMSAIPENEYGQKIAKDSNLLIDWSCRGRLGNHTGFQIRPLGFINDHSRVEFIEAYLHYHLKYLHFEIGKDALWWGQGAHGTLQLTNNAKPFKLIRLTSDSPFILPSFLQYLGLGRFSFFITELEEDRPYSGGESSHPDIHQPKFSGLKISFKISPYFEAGLTRTFLFEKWGDFGKAFLARHENSKNGPGNQIGGFDWRITLPLRFQPVTLYGEHAGEDEAGLLPSAWAHLGGIYLPAIGQFSQIRFRVEYANIHSGNKPDAWYVHSSTNDGLAYTYYDQIMGHHMGSNSEDLYVALEWEFRNRLRVSPAFDFERRWAQGKISEKQYQYQVSVEFPWSENNIWEVKFFREFTENLNQGAQNREDNTRIFLSWQLFF